VHFRALFAELLGSDEDAQHDPDEVKEINR
jgi:hypothetical protein